MTGPKEIDVSKAGPGDEQVKFICPFMSGQAVPVQVTGKIATPDGPGIVTLEVPCALERCGCFDFGSDTCSLSRLPSLVHELNGGVQLIEDSLNFFTESVNSSKDAWYKVMMSAVSNGVVGVTVAIHDLTQRFDPPLNGKTPLAELVDAVKKLTEMVSLKTRKDK